MLNTVVGILGSATIIVVGWVFTLGSRVTVLEAQDGPTQKLIESQLAAIDKRLARIERHVLNGHFVAEDEE